MKLAAKEDIYNQFETHAAFIEAEGERSPTEYVDYKSIIDKMFFTPGNIKEVYAVDFEKFMLNGEEKKCKIWAWKGPVDSADQVEAIKADAVYVFMPLFVTGILQNGISPLMQTKAGASWYYAVNQEF